MSTSYPSGIDNFENKLDNFNWVEAADINNLQDAVHAVESELGINAAGAFTSVGEALSYKINKAGDTLAGNLNFDKHKAINLVVERVGTLPAWVASDEGRILYCETDRKIYMGTNTEWRKVCNYGFGDGLSVTGDEVAVDSTVVRFSNIGDGLEVDGGSIQVDDTVTRTSDFDDGLMVEGKIISVDNTVVRTAGDQLINGLKAFIANTIRIGDQTTNTHKVIEAFIRDSANPSFRYNKDLGKWQYSDNGVDYKDIMSLIAGSGLEVSGDTISVDSTVVRTTGSQVISGRKIFVAAPSDGSFSEASLLVNPSTGAPLGLLFAVGIDNQERFSVNLSGDTSLAGNINFLANKGLSWDDCSFVRLNTNTLRANGLFEVIGLPAGSNASLTVNPATSPENCKLMWVGVGNVEKFSVDDAGDTVMAGNATIEGSLGVDGSIDTLGNCQVGGNLSVTDHVISDLKLDDSRKLQWSDTNLYRSTSDSLKTDDKLIVSGVPVGSNPSLKVNPAASDTNTKLVWAGVNDVEKFSVDDGGDVAIAGEIQVVGNSTTGGSLQVGGNVSVTGVVSTDLKLDDSKKLQWSDVNLYRSTSDSLKTDDKLVVSGSPVGSIPSLKVNPATADTNTKLVWAGVNDVEKFSVDDAGDVAVAGDIQNTGNINTAGNAQVGGNLSVTGNVATDLKIDDSKKLQWSDTNLYRSAANKLKTDDCLVVAGAAGTTVTDATLCVNVSSPAEDSYLLTVNTNGSELFSVNSAGDINVKGFYQQDLGEELETGNTLIKANVQSGQTGSYLEKLSVGSVDKFSVDVSGNVEAAGNAELGGNLEVGGNASVTGSVVTDLKIDDSKKLQWSDTNLYRSAANKLKTDDCLVVAGTAGTTVTDAALCVNVTSPEEDTYLLTVASSSNELFSVNSAGDVSVKGFFSQDMNEEIESGNSVIRANALSGETGSYLEKLSVNNVTKFSVDIGGNVEAAGSVSGNLRSANNGAGAPSGGVDGDFYVDTTNNRLYIKIGGTWRYAALT